MQDLGRFVGLLALLNPGSLTRLQGMSVFFYGLKRDKRLCERGGKRSVEYRKTVLLPKTTTS